MLTNWKRRWRALWQPAMYHGWTRRHHYFEGWYFKLVAPKGRAALAFIPGIAMEGDGQQHAFIQVLDGLAERAHYYEFPAADFRPAEDHFALQLGDNFFSSDQVRLALPDFSGSLQFQNRSPWPRRWGAPGIMGWYSFVPFMETYHDVLSMNHELVGSLHVKNQAIDFSGGRGYLEKDWGRSFPSSWIWIQSNHLNHPAPASLFFSVARVPWLGSHFVGFICGFLINGQLHQMATYSGAKLKIKLVDRQIHLHLSDKQRQLQVIGTPGPGAALVSPISGQMRGKVNESLQATLHLTFDYRGKRLYEGIAQNAGLEIAGDIAGELITDRS